MVAAAAADYWTAGLNKQQRSLSTCAVGGERITERTSPIAIIYPPANKKTSTYD